MSFSEEITQIENEKEWNIHRSILEIQQLLQYIDLLRENMPEAKNRDINELIASIIHTTVCYSLKPIKSDVCFQKTLEYIKENPNSIIKVLNTTSEMEFMQASLNKPLDYHLQENIKQCVRSIAKSIIGEWPKEKRICLLKEKLPKQELEKLASEINKICESLNEKMKKTIQKEYVDKICAIAEFLWDYGSLARSNEKNTQVLKNMGLEILSFSTEKQNNKKIAIEDLCEEDFVGKLSEQELTALSTFLTNRFVKIVEKIFDYTYVLKKIGVLQKIENSEPYTLDEEIINKLLLQINFLKKVVGKNYRQIDKTVSQNIELQMQDGIEQDESETGLLIKELDLQEIFHRIDLEELDIEPYKKQYEKEYNTYYGKKMPAIYNDFDNDFREVIGTQITKSNIYDVKDASINALILYLLREGSDLNWGYIPEKMKETLSMHSNQKYMLIGIDFQGYNFPIRLHIKKDEIKEAIKQWNGSERIPIYEGFEDMIVHGRYISTQILMPFQKYQKKFLRTMAKQVKEIDENANFIKHLAWMTDAQIYPQFILERNVNSKFRREINLETGEIGVYPRKPVNNQILKDGQEK